MRNETLSTLTITCAGVVATIAALLQKSPSSTEARFRSDLKIEVVVEGRHSRITVGQGVAVARTSSAMVVHIIIDNNKERILLRACIIEDSKKKIKPYKADLQDRGTEAAPAAVTNKTIIKAACAGETSMIQMLRLPSHKASNRAVFPPQPPQALSTSPAVEANELSQTVSAVQSRNILIFD